MILEELFLNMSTFRRYVPGIESNVSFDELSSSALSAKKRIVNIISLDVYNRVVKEGKEPVDSLKSAVANYVAYKQVPFDAIKTARPTLMFINTSKRPCNVIIWRTTTIRWIHSYRS